MQRIRYPQSYRRAPDRRALSALCRKAPMLATLLLPLYGFAVFDVCDLIVADVLLKERRRLRIALSQARLHSTKNKSADAHRSCSLAMDHRALHPRHTSRGAVVLSPRGTGD